MVKIKEGFADEIAAGHDENYNRREQNESGDENHVENTEVNSSNHSSPEEPEKPLDFVTLSTRYNFSFSTLFQSSSSKLIS